MILFPTQRSPGLAWRAIAQSVKFSATAVDVEPAMINAREGMRRLGLLLGTLGAIVGCVYLFAFGDELLEKRARAKEFRELSSVVQEVVRATPLHAEEHPELRLANGYEYVDPTWLRSREDALRSHGISSVEWSKNGDTIYAITTVDDTNHYDTSAPKWWDYIGVLFLPALGFLLPWGTIRILVWVGGGFFQRTPPIAVPPKD